MNCNDLKSEIDKYNPTDSEKRKDAFISLYYIVVFLLLGLPMWYVTTTTYRAALPLADIDELARSQIAIVIKVNVINFENDFDMDELFELQDKLLQRLGDSDGDGRVVTFKFTGFVRQASREEAKLCREARTTTDLDGINAYIDDTNAVHILLLPTDSPVWPDSAVDGVVRGSADRNVALVRAATTERLATVIAHLVTHLVARADDLNLVYRAALDVPEKESLEKMPAHIRPFLSRVRSAPKYEWAFSLIVPHPKGGPLPEWDFPQLEHLYLEPLMRRLAPFVEVRVTSQLLYQVRLERLWPSRAAKGGQRSYSREDLTHLVNGIEPYLSAAGAGAANSALQFVSYVASDGSAHSDAVHLDGVRPGGPEAFSVPRWGGMAIWNNATIPLDGAALMPVFLPQIRALMGLSSRHRPRDGAGVSLLMEAASEGAGGVSAWQLHTWLRERTVEQLAVTRVTLQSIALLLDRVTNIVIRDDVAGHIHVASKRCRDAMQALASAIDGGALHVAFLSSKQALQSAEMAFFHPSLLELLYFQDDQKIGIYIPLFVPVVIPVLLAAMKAAPVVRAAFGHAKVD